MFYSDLQPGVYYLIKSDNDDLIELVSVLMQTTSAVLLRSYLPEMEDFLVLKADDIQIVEELDDSIAEQFFSVYGEEEVFDEENIDADNE